MRQKCRILTYFPVPIQTAIPLSLDNYVTAIAAAQT